ncbi:MAG TPA: Rid family hydrolase [Gemmatales bacterium]|nr:Rid family hydrolase [Gemmatales bacterium]
MQIERWSSKSNGRSRTVAFGDLIWTVAHGLPTETSFELQASQSLSMLEAHLLEAGSAKTHLLSVQVILTNIANRQVFDRYWQEWIGPHPEHWPQRACYQGSLAPGLLGELIAVAARASFPQMIRS